MLTNKIIIAEWTSLRGNLKVDFSPESEQGAFNAGIEYLRTLTAIERELDQMFKDKYLEQINELLDILWMELAEWMDEEELKFHQEIRKKQQQCHREIIKELQKGKTMVSFEAIETYKIRNMELKKIIHSKGLRMPRKDDASHALI